MANHFDVLVVDDDVDMRETLCGIIEGEGLRVMVAADGRTALEALLKGLRPSLILLDLMMPSMDGWDVLSAIRRDSALTDIPVAVISATCDRAPPPGATHFLPKPVDLNTLLASCAARAPGAGRAHGIDEPRPRQAWREAGSSNGDLPGYLLVTVDEQEGLRARAWRGRYRRCPRASW